MITPKNSRILQAIKCYGFFSLITIAALLTMNSGVTLAQTTIYTPNGTGVTALTISEFSPSQIAQLNSDATTEFPNATMLSDASATYNCHSYAWYLTACPGYCARYWINSPGDDTYWNDCSYLETSVSSQAQKISYPAGDHSAIKSVVSGKYDSKWGSWPLMRHDPTDAPYNYSGLKYYVKPEISGTSIICSSQVYQVYGVPSGQTVSWSSTWNSAPYPTLTQNSPSTNQATMTNTYSYPSSTTLTATVSGVCGQNLVLTKAIMSEYNNAVQYGTYTQPSCYANGFNQVPLSGNLPYTVNTPTYIHQVCVAEIVLSQAIGKTVTNIGGSEPQYWNYNSSNFTLTLQLAEYTGGIPYTFRISGEGSCVNKDLLFFGYLGSSGYPYLVAPNPVDDMLKLYPNPEDEASMSSTTSKELEGNPSVFIYEELTGILVHQQDDVKGDVEKQIDVTKLRKGYYILRIVNGDKIQNIKFLKE